MRELGSLNRVPFTPVADAWTWFYCHSADSWFHGGIIAPEIGNDSRRPSAEVAALTRASLPRLVLRRRGTRQKVNPGRRR